MAYLQARSGIARSGVTYCGWTPPSVTVYINGTNRTNLLLRDGITITTRADGTPATFTFRIRSVAPVVGQDVTVLYATPNDYIFGGTLLQVTAAPEAPHSNALIWECTAVGYQWLLDRYDLVLRQYVNRGVGTIAADILHSYTNGSFRVGYCPSSLGNVTMEFTFENVWTALQRLAKAADAVCRLGPNRVVDIYPAGTYPEAALANVTEDTVLAKSLTHRKDLTQVRTRTLYKGHGTTASAAANGGATTLAVNDSGIFSSAGGSAITGRSLFTYTGTSTASGAGNLTGVSGLLYDVASGDAVNVIVDEADSAAQTALATLLGGGLSGQVTNYLADERLSESEATARAAADLATFGGALEEVGFTYQTAQRYVYAGRAVTIAISNPLTISGSFTIQGVTLVPYGEFGGANFEVYQQVECGSFTRTLNDLLKQLR